MKKFISTFVTYFKLTCIHQDMDNFSLHSNLVWWKEVPIIQQILFDEDAYVHKQEDEIVSPNKSHKINIYKCRWCTCVLNVDVASDNHFHHHLWIAIIKIMQSFTIGDYIHVFKLVYICYKVTFWFNWMYVHIFEIVYYKPFRFTSKSEQSMVLLCSGSAFMLTSKAKIHCFTISVWSSPHSPFASKKFRDFAPSAICVTFKFAIFSNVPM